jgi:Flagellar motor switch/type III secretory pathway protein
MAPDLSILPTMEPAIAELVNRFAASAWFFPLPQEADADLVVQFRHARLEQGTCAEIAISASFGTVFLYVDTGLVDVLSDLLLPGWREEAPDSLPLEWRAVLILEDLVRGTRFENLGAVELRLTSAPARKDGPPLSALSGVVTVAGDDFGFMLQLSGLGEEAAAAFASLQPHGRLNAFDPGFCCRLCLPGKPLPIASYRTIARGDTLLAGTISQDRLPVFIEVPQVARFRAELERAGGTIRIEEKIGFQNIMNDIDDDYGPPELEAGALYDHPPIADPLEDLPVRLDFLLSTRRISLSELRALGPGATLDLNLDLTRPVTILANGAPAAKGYLVQIGDRVGVQISHWPGIGEGGDG